MNIPSAILTQASSLLSDLFDKGIPLQSLLRTGTFPPDWPDRYLTFVESVHTHYGQDLPLPREILAVIYNASVYCTKRYHDWQSHTGSTNETTEALIKQVRHAGDQLILARYYRLPPTSPHNPSPSSDTTP